MGGKQSQAAPELQGEGNRDADRQYREAAQRHAESGKSEPAARDAEESIENEGSDDFDRAEEAGKSRAKGPASR
jgi:hypothetical protein